MVPNNLESNTNYNQENSKKGTVEQPKRLMHRLSLFVLLVFLVYVAANALISWNQGNFLFETQSYQMIMLLTISGVVILDGLLFGCHFLLKRCSEKAIKCMLIGMVLLAFSVQCYFLFYIRSLYLFDNAFVTGGASTLAMSEGIADGAKYYFSVYPNQNAYIVLTAVLWKLGNFFKMTRSQIPFLLNTVNMICLDTAFLLAYAIYTKLVPKTEAYASAKRATFAILLMLNPFLYIGVCYYYTITLSMPFFMAILFLFVAYIMPKEKTPRWVWPLMAFLFATGYLMRATTIIPMIAIIFIWLYFGPRKKEFLAVIFFSVIFVLALGKINTAYVGIDTTDTAFPTTHWIMMSMTSPGSHNAEDESYTASFLTQEEKKAAIKQRMQEKLAAMTPEDIFFLFSAKLLNTWKDGSNGYTVYLENCVGTGGPYEYIYGQKKDFVLWYHQIYYVLLLMLFIRNIPVDIRFFDGQTSKTRYLWQLTLLGGILFYLLWETSAQYSVPFMLVLMLGGAGGAGVAFEKQSALNHQRYLSNKRVYTRFGMIYVLCALFLLAFFIRKYPLFTQLDQSFDKTVVKQILANDELRIGADEVFIQSFEASEPFNQIVFQYTNPNKDDGAVYECSLADEQGSVLATHQITQHEGPNRNADIWSFETVEPKGKRSYIISIRQLLGKQTDQLGIITYTMGHYDAYPQGKCLLDDQELETEMLFAVSKKEQKPYASKKGYLIVGISAMTIVFLPIFVILVYTIQYMVFFQKHGKNTKED